MLQLNEHDKAVIMDALEFLRYVALADILLRKKKIRKVPCKR